jgi:3-phosphoshikimate 1-carboxyvinyltransferase
LLKQFGANVTTTESSVTVKKGNMKGIEIDASQIPDLVPVLGICATGAVGTTKIYNAYRLRIKESDRLKTTADAIKSLGGIVEETQDGLIIQGTGSLKGGKANGCNDHRIVMSSAVASVICKENVIITDSEAINKSYPVFFEDFKKLGGNVSGVSNR